MQSFEAIPAAPHFAGGILPVLKGMFDELCATLARLIAYFCALALLFILGVHLWDQMSDIPSEPPVRTEWTLATRSVPAFASNNNNLAYETRTYDIFRHPEGGRKDVLRWYAADTRPIAELEIHRRGGEFDPAPLIDGAGSVETKFGPVVLHGRADDGCLSFLKSVAQPDLRISGFVCQGETLPARGAAVACLLNRLSLIAAGNDARLAEFFARAEMKRADCRSDWVSGSDKPSLRGAI